MGKKISQASGQKKKHLKISSLTLLLPPHQSVSVQAFLLNHSCSKFPHFYKCPSSPFSSDIPFTVPVFSFTFLLLCLMCEHFFPCLLPLSTINFPSIFQQRHHISSHWFRFWCMMGFHPFQNYVETGTRQFIAFFHKGHPCSFLLQNPEFYAQSVCKKTKAQFCLCCVPVLVTSITQIWC